MQQRLATGPFQGLPAFVSLGLEMGGGGSALLMNFLAGGSSGSGRNRTPASQAALPPPAVLLKLIRCCKSCYCQALPCKLFP